MGATVPNDELVRPTPETPAGDPAAPAAEDARPVWTRPQIVSYAPITDARSNIDMMGDGISNAS